MAMPEALAPSMVDQAVDSPEAVEHETSTKKLLSSDDAPDFASLNVSGAPCAAELCKCVRLFQPFKPPANWRTTLATLEDMPPRLKRRGIHWGYRPKPYAQTWDDVYASLTYLHNETINIYSHIIAFILITLLACWRDNRPLTHFAAGGGGSSLSFGDAFFTLWFFVGTCTMLGFSALFHCIYCHSERVHAGVLSCDLSGIVIAICSATDVSIWLLFRCDPGPRNGYLLAFNLLAALVLPIALLPRLRTKQMLVVPAFTSMAVAGIIPVFHVMAQRGGWPGPDDPQLGVCTGVITMLGCYGFGLVFYCFKWPETGWPGRFDFFLHSHQIWHVCIFIAPCVQYAGLRRTMLHYDGVTCPT